MFNAFTPLAGGSLGTYAYASESPFDLDAGLDFTRPQRTYALMPEPPMIGYIDGFLPLLDTVEYATMKGKTPSGPWMGSPQGNLDRVFPAITGGLAKTTG